MKILQWTRIEKRLAATALSLLAIAALVISSGCNSETSPTPENFTKALNTYFLEHPDCLLVDMRFPYETSDPAKTKQLNTLVKSQLLDVSVETAIHASRYTVTAAGTRYAPRFCFGHREITSIDGSTPPVVANGFKQSQVTYHYTMQDTPVWAKSADVLAAFPTLALATSGQATGKATLSQTIAGWEVSD